MLHLCLCLQHRHFHHQFHFPTYFHRLSGSTSQSLPSVEYLVQDPLSKSVGFPKFKFADFTVVKVEKSPTLDTTYV